MNEKTGERHTKGCRGRAPLYVFPMSLRVLACLVASLRHLGVALGSRVHYALFTVIDGEADLKKKVYIAERKV